MQSLPDFPKVTKKCQTFCLTRHKICQTERKSVRLKQMEQKQSKNIFLFILPPYKLILLGEFNFYVSCFTYWSWKRHDVIINLKQSTKIDISNRFQETMCITHKRKTSKSNVVRKNCGRRKWVRIGICPSFFVIEQIITNKSLITVRLSFYKFIQ